MDYNLEDLIDISLFQRLQEKLNLLHPFPSAIIDNKGKILTAVAWQDICTKFHRQHPISEKECIKSDQYIFEHIQEANPSICYQCPHGLVDNAFPIIIDGKHLANFFTGQFFLEKPDLDFFRKQAKIYGFDEKSYLEAVEKTPIWTKEKLGQFLDFIKVYIEIITGIALENLKATKAHTALKKSEERNNAIIQSTTDWIWELDKNLNYSYCSERAEQKLGYTPNEIIGKSPFDLIVPEEHERISAYLQKAKETKSPIVDLENWKIHKNGDKVCFLSNGFPEFDKNGELAGYCGAEKDITDRKREEESLSYEKRRLDSILEGTNSGSWEWNIQTGELFLNNRWAEIIGYTLAELSPVTIKTWMKLIHPGDLIVSNKLLKKHFKGESNFYEMELRMRHKNSDWIWVLDRGQVHQWDINGKPLLMSGTHVDINKRKNAEKALIESEARLIQAQSVAKVGSWETNLLTMAVIWSNETYRIFGVNQKNFKPTYPGFLTFVHPDDRTNVDETFKTSVGNYSFNVMEHRIITPDGSVKFIEERWEIVCDDQGIAFKAVGTCQDITEHKNSEEVIIRLNERISMATHSAQVGIWDWDLGNSKLEWDEQMYSLYGRKKEILSTDFETWLNGIHPNDKARSESEAILALSHEKDYDSEFRVIWPDGSIHFLKSKAQVIRDVNGKPQRMVGVNYDITPLKQVEQELLYAKERAEEGDRLKTAFLANMSHEIRTPMNGILGFAGLLKEPKLSGEEQQEYISIIEQSGARMLNIINDIIDISKIESGQMKISVSPTNINEQIEFIYHFFKQEADKQGLQLHFRKSLPAKLSIIRTDREKVYAIMTNLIKNAIKFTPKGTIEFGYLPGSVETHAPSLQEPSLYTPNLLTFFVKDTGIGIPVGRQSAIFDRFIQADIGDKRAFQGAGLGLSISKAYIEMLGGKIWVESEEGKGSCFYFTLPYNNEPSELNYDNVGAITDDSTSQSSNLKILIAEDDETSELLITLGLKKYCKKFLTVKTGIEAVEICRNDPEIDLILMDIKMPEMDGYEATRQIRKFNNDVVIIAQTAYALIGDREKALAAGCNDYISKPFGGDLLVSIIKKHF